MPKETDSQIMQIVSWLSRSSNMSRRKLVSAINDDSNSGIGAQFVQTNQQWSILYPIFSLRMYKNTSMSQVPCCSPECPYGRNPTALHRDHLPNLCRGRTNGESPWHCTRTICSTVKTTTCTHLTLPTGHSLSPSWQEGCARSHYVELPCFSSRLRYILPETGRSCVNCKIACIWYQSALVSKSTKDPHCHLVLNHNILAEESVSSRAFHRISLRDNLLMIS